MKRLTLLLFILILFVQTSFGQSAASDFLASPSQYLDKKITIAAIGGYATCIALADYVVFDVETANGNIFVMVSSRKSNNFVSGLPRKGSGSSKSYSGAFTTFQDGQSHRYALQLD